MRAVAIVLYVYTDRFAAIHWVFLVCGQNAVPAYSWLNHSPEQVKCCRLSSERQMLTAWRQMSMSSVQWVTFITLQAEDSRSFCQLSIKKIIASIRDMTSLKCTLRFFYAAFSCYSYENWMARRLALAILRHDDHFFPTTINHKRRPQIFVQNIKFNYQTHYTRGREAGVAERLKPIDSFENERILVFMLLLMALFLRRHCPQCVRIIHFQFHVLACDYIYFTCSWCVTPTKFSIVFTLFFILIVLDECVFV